MKNNIDLVDIIEAIESNIMCKYFECGYAYANGREYRYTWRLESNCPHYDGWGHTTFINFISSKLHDDSQVIKKISPELTISQNDIKKYLNKYFEMNFCSFCGGLTKIYFRYKNGKLYYSDQYAKNKWVPATWAWFFYVKEKW